MFQISRFVSVLTIMPLLIAPLSCASRSAAGHGSAADTPPLQPGHFDEHARPSIDALVDDLIAAITAKDKESMKEMRVTGHEYMDIIIPGSVPVGQAPRRNSEKVKTFMWELLNEKSNGYRDVFFKRFEGHQFKRTELTFTEGTRDYAWYKAHGEVRAKMVDERGTIWNLETGWIAEVDGKFKFIGYQYD
jgi:hypothetical protein